MGRLLRHQRKFAPAGGTERTRGQGVIVRWETDHDYVLVHIHQDMFGDWIFSRAWGPVSSNHVGLPPQLVDYS